MSDFLPDFFYDDPLRVMYKGFMFLDHGSGHKIDVVLFVHRVHSGVLYVRSEDLSLMRGTLCLSSFHARLESEKTV